MIHYLIALSIGLVWAGAAGAEQLKLANGDVLNAEIVDWAVDHVVIEHPQLGRVRLELSELAIDRGKEPSRGLFDTRFMRGWKRRIDFGWNGREGDETRKNITAGLRFSYKDPFKRWNLNGRYRFQESTDDDPDNNLRLDLSRDWLFPGSNWFGRVATRYQYDEFESWEHRTIVGAGPGYHLLRTEAHTLDGILTPVFTREYGDVSENRSEVVFALEWTWKIWKNIELDAKNQLFVGLSPDSGDVRNFTIANLEIGLIERPDLDLLLGIENEYETDPDPGDQRNDLFYNITLGLSF